MYNISQAKKSDFSKIFDLFQELWPNERLSKNKTKEIWEKILDKKDSFQLVLKEDNEIVGYSAVSCRWDIESKGKIGYLSELIVTRKCQGKGYGLKLLKESMKRAKVINCVELQFPSTSKRKKAWKLYRALGFKATASFFWKKL